MSFIHVLDDNTINKIAAGEVVERPASVVKELVENAIDAKADRIEVEIMAGGTSFMRVSDNGIGMSREDAARAVLRHATSKILQVDDLQNIDTLGFRGEALPSIASVSRFSLQTRQAGAELGTEIKISGGKSTEVEEVGCGLGTTVMVEDLFFNTPARKKFLKTNNTEGGKINEFIIKLAVSKPHIAFKLINNNKAAIATPGSGNLRETLQSIYGSTLGDALLPLDFTDEDIRIDGFVSKPSAIRSSRSWQTFIVNGRIIANRAIARAIDNAYHALIPKTGYPLVAMTIEVPQHTIDVNVHPQKSEMKFEDEGRIFKAVYKAVLDAVHPKEQARDLGAVAAEAENLRRHVQNGWQELQEKQGSTSAAARPYMADILDIAGSGTAADGSSLLRHQEGGGSAAYGQPRQSSLSWHEAAAVLQREKAAAMQQEKDFAAALRKTAAGDSASASQPSRQMVPVGQVDNTYIVAQDADSLYIVDQHAAHERILFDRFSEQAAQIPVQQLLVHLLLDFSSHEGQLLEENLAMLAELGFGLEPSGPHQFRLTEVPADIPSGEAEDFIREILASLEELHKPTAAELRKAAIATTACKAAIKAGFRLNMRQMELLLEELNRTAMPYTCPHGRPTILKFSSDELAKMFKRTGF